VATARRVVEDLNDLPPDVQHGVESVAWPCGGFDESHAIKAVQDVIDGTRLSLPGVGDALNGAVPGLAIEVDLVEDEVVGMFRLDVPLAECLGREVLDVRSDDHLGAGGDGSGEDMPVVGVRDRQCVDERFVSRR